jgi:hypothetical protein
VYSVPHIFADVAELCAALFSSTLNSLAAAKAWSSYLTDITIALWGALIPDAPLRRSKSPLVSQPLLPKSISVPTPFPPRRDVEPLFSYPEPLFQAQFSQGVRDLTLSLLICRATCVVVLDPTSLEVLQLLADLSAAFVSSSRSPWLREELNVLRWHFLGRYSRFRLPLSLGIPFALHSMVRARSLLYVCCLSVRAAVASLCNTFHGETLTDESQASALLRALDDVNASLDALDTPVPRN